MQHKSVIFFFVSIKENAKTYKIAALYACCVRPSLYITEPVKRFSWKFCENDITEGQPYSQKKKIRRLTKFTRFTHVVCVRFYITPNQLRDFRENSVKMIEGHHTLKKREFTALQNSHALCMSCASVYIHYRTS